MTHEPNNPECDCKEQFISQIADCIVSVEGQWSNVLLGTLVKVLFTKNKFATFIITDLESVQKKATAGQKFVENYLVLLEQQNQPLNLFVQAIRATYYKVLFNYKSFVRFICGFFQR